MALTLLLTFATFAAYGPSLTGGFVWDDDAHVTAPHLRSLGGLGQIWADPAATQQYYPLLHTAFWMQHRLWGDAPLGYHVVSVLLHVAAAVLLGVLWRGLRLPGATLGPFLFALHPVATESVAWISEQKNTLSTTLYLGAALLFLRFHRTRGRGWYVLATLSFVAALLSKSVTATLPAAILVLLWWRSGSIRWRRDALPLVPWFALGVAMGITTILVEKHVVGAKGSQWHATIADRVLVAGRAMWFYAGKVIWPSDLSFMYPRWVVSPEDARQWLYPIGAAAAIGLLWAFRNRSRAPLSVALLFAGSLFPALGFFDVYPFRYSFVADHFQYLPAMFLLAASATLLVTIAGRLRLGPVVAGAGSCLLGAVLLLLTHTSASRFRDAESLYASILAADPGSWFAHHNLGMLLLDRGRPEQAVEHISLALRARPEMDEIRFGLALALARAGREGEAAAAYESAFRAGQPNADAENNFGNLLRRMGRRTEAAEHLRRAIALDPHHPEAHHNLGLLLATEGRWPEAIDSFDQALKRNPSNPDGWLQRGTALLRAGRPQDAIASFQEALALRPALVDAERGLATALTVAGRPAEALPLLRAVAQRMPADPDAALQLGSALLDSGDLQQAVARLQDAVRLDGRSALAHDRLAVALFRAGDATKALTHFEEAVQLEPREPEFRFDLALALAALGRRRDAVAQLNAALGFSPQHARSKALRAKLLEGSNG